MLRTLPMRQRGRLPPPRRLFRVRDMEGGPFTLLAREEDRALVFGLVGQFWRPTGGARPIATAEFAAFAEPGCAKLVYGFWLEPAGGDRIRLTTATAIFCPDLASRSAMTLYWLAIRPISGLIRREILAAVKQASESQNPAS